MTLLVVSVLAFLIPYAGEGDPARKILRARVNDPALAVSVSLAIAALLLALVFALPLGTWAATTRSP